MLTERTRRKKRISCVKDVLARLRYRNVQEGNYLAYWHHDHKIADKLEKLAEKLDEKRDKKPSKKEICSAEKCEACARGNLFLSHLRLFDKVTCYELANGDQDIQDKFLLDYFDKHQLDLIEAAFEGRDVQCTLSDDELDDACKFYATYDNPKDRLKAICQNILKNKGTFIP